MITIKLGVIDLRVIDDDYLKKLFKIVNDYRLRLSRVWCGVTKRLTTPAIVLSANETIF